MSYTISVVYGNFNNFKCSKKKKNQVCIKYALLIFSSADFVWNIHCLVITIRQIWQICVKSNIIFFHFLR